MIHPPEKPIVERNDYGASKTRIADELIRRTGVDGELPKLYADGGHTARYVRQMRRRSTLNPTLKQLSEKAVEMWLEEYFELCELAMQPPTVGGLATWFSVTIQTLQYWANKDEPKGHLLAMGIQTCQQFAELKAMEGALNPVLYMYQNKAYHGHIELQKVEIVESKPHLSIDDIDDIINMLPDDDGVYHEVDTEDVS